MAKKGGVQQLQADISTNEEFDKFLERSGLLVMDVYTEWCGPCIAMVGSLKKIKLEIGGDNLHLAICKSDTISALKRFRNKSEPTWLFASHGKAVNIMFGTNVPQLVKLIIEELNLELSYQNGEAQRTFYEITELQPVELERIGIQKAQEDEARRIENEVASQKRRDYLLYVTDEIMKNMPEFGYTIFAPHINRDLFKKILDVSDSQMLQCKDRKVGTVVPENLEVIQFDCPNPLSDEIWKCIFDKELLICLWRKDDSDNRDINDVLEAFIKNLITPQSLADEYNEYDIVAELPPLIPSAEVSLTIILEDNQELERNSSIKSKKDSSSMEIKESIKVENDALSGKSEVQEQDQTKSGESILMNVNNKTDITTEEVETSETEIKQESIKVIVPGVWAPNNKRGHAAGIYVFFRSHTFQFLPPDPEPDPPHLIVAFDAYKRKNIQDVCERFKEDILSYGYFTSCDPENAQLIANSTTKYEAKPPNVTDKLVLKVAKVTSHAILTLAAHGPAYVSPNTVVGEKECKIFFPEDYKTGEIEEEELKLANLKNAEKNKKKKKKKTESSDEQLGTAVAQETSVEEIQETDAEDLAADEELGDEGDELEGDEGDGEIEGSENNDKTEQD